MLRRGTAPESSKAGLLIELVFTPSELQRDYQSSANRARIADNNQSSWWENRMSQEIRSRVILSLILCAVFGCNAGAQQNQDAMQPKQLEQSAFDVIGISVRTNNAAEATGNGAIPKQWQRLF